MKNCLLFGKYFLPSFEMMFGEKPLTKVTSLLTLIYNLDLFSDDNTIPSKTKSCKFIDRLLIGKVMYI